MKNYGLLLDTTSIQRYIFGSNKLKENIGASYIVEKIYEKNFIENLDCEKPLKDGDNYKGFIGGGNALFYFKEIADAKAFLKELSTRLLIYAPGLTLAAEIGEIDDDNYKKTIGSLYKKLTEHKSANIVQTIIPRHGITAECPHSGFSAECPYQLPDPKADKYFISSVSNSKLSASKRSNEEIDEIFKDVIKHDYCFTSDLEDKRKKSYSDSPYRRKRNGR